MSSRHAVFELGPPRSCPDASVSSLAGTERILVYGDSLTAGYPDYVPYAKALIASCASVGLELTVSGCGLCGFMVSDMRSHLHDRGIRDACRRVGIGLRKMLEDESADAGPFSLVLIMAGTNDILEGTDGPEEIACNIQSLHETCHDFGTHTAILSVPSFRGEPGHLEVRSKVNDRLQEWACGPISRPVHFVDSAKLLPYNEGSGAWEPDGIHFSEKGSQIFGRALAPCLLHWLRPALVNKFDMLTSEAVAEQEQTQTAAASGFLSFRPKRVLVLGGAVAHGAGASVGNSWAERFGCAVQAHGFELHNESTDDARLEVWQQRLCSLSAENFEGYSVVVFSLCGVLECQSAGDLEGVDSSFLERLQLIAFLLRGKMIEDARLVFASPCPPAWAPDNMLDAMREMEDVDHVIDFLQQQAGSGLGPRVDGATSGEDGFPNDVGHHAMYQCIDVPAVLGSP